MASTEIDTHARVHAFNLHASIMRVRIRIPVYSWRSFTMLRDFEEIRYYVLYTVYKTLILSLICIVALLCTLERMEILFAIENVL